MALAAFLAFAVKHFGLAADHLRASTALSTPYGYVIERRVPVKTMEDFQDTSTGGSVDLAHVITQLRGTRQPVIIRQPPELLQWPALRLWDMEYLKKKIGKMEGLVYWRNLSKSQDDIRRYTWWYLKVL